MAEALAGGALRGASTPAAAEKYTEPMVSPTAEAVTKSAGRFTAALVVQKLVSFAYFTVAARLVGPRELGTYVLAVNLAMLVGAVADLGLANLLTREVAKAPERAGRLLSVMLTAKATLLALAFAALQLVVPQAIDDPVVRVLLWGTGIAMVLDAVTLLLYAVVRGQHRLQAEGVGSIASQVAVAACGMGLLAARPSSTSLVLALIAGSLVGVLYSARLVVRSGVKLRLGWSAAEFSWLWRTVWPFAAALLLTRLYGYADGVLVGTVRGAEAAGLYGVPAKFVTSLQFVPLAFVAALYPALSAAYAARDRESLGRLFSHGVRYLWVCGVAAAVCLVGLAPSIIGSLYGKAYLASVPVLEVAALQLPLLFVSFPLGSLLNACDRQRRTTVAVAVALLTDLALLWLLLPPLGLVGAAIASACASLAMVLAQLLSAGGLAALRPGPLIGKMTLVASIGLAAGLAGRAATSVVAWPAAMAGALVAFLALCLLAGAVTAQDFRAIRSVLRP